MNGIFNKSRLWFCDIFERTINFSITLRHNKSKPPKHEKDIGTILKEYNFIRTKFDKVTYLLNDTIKDCRNEFSHSFQYRCEYDFKFIILEKKEEVILSISLGYMK